MQNEEVEKGVALIMYLVTWPATIWASFHYHLNPKPLWLWVTLFVFAPGIFGIYLGKSLNRFNSERE